MTPVSGLSDAEITALLDGAWDLRECRVTPMHPSMNSSTWLVELDDERWVAKAVPTAEQPAFPGGLAVAAIVDALGVPAGAPIPTVAGELVASFGTWVVGLLR